MLLQVLVCILISLLSDASCLVAPPVFLSSCRPQSSLRSAGSTIIRPSTPLYSGYVGLLLDEHRLRKDPKNGRSRFYPMKDTTHDLSGSWAESFMGLRESCRDRI
ncbi:MAG: hypothetical protein LKG25_09135 [Prevotella sp.]|nr:hypothetical protein [Prevotella sp.]